MTFPFSSKTCVIPIFLPSNPLSTVCLFEGLCLNLDVNARRDVQFRQRIHRFGGRFEHINETLMSSNLKLFTRLFVHVGRAKDCVPLDTSGKRYRSFYPCARALGGLHDL